MHAEVRAATSSAVDNAIASAKGHALWRTVEVSQADGRTGVSLRFELPKVTHLVWSERVVADALAMLEAVAPRPGLEVDLVARNVDEAAKAPLLTRLASLTKLR